ncbi:MAG: lipid A deacylase LpxR family protein [Pseudomonadota bacterium]
MRHRRLFFSTLLAMAWSILPLKSAFADDLNETIVVTIENDIFTGSDNNYTNGFAATWTSDALSEYEKGSLPKRIANGLDFMPGFDGDQDYLTFSLVHQINTPSDITIANPPLNDQPYSGVLLFGTGLFSDRPNGSQLWTLRIGAIGPVTQADHIQIEFHDWIGADEPLGWETQLPNEALFNIGYLRTGTVAEAGPSSRFDWRFNAIGSFEIGNYATAAAAGGIFEFGGRRNDTRTTVSIENGIGIVPEPGAARSEGLDVSAYIGAGTFAVAHFAPLDGTTFRSSRSVDYSPLIGFTSVGLTARYGRLLTSFSLNKGVTFSNTDAEVDYGAISIGWTY